MEFDEGTLRLDGDQVLQCVLGVWTPVRVSEGANPTQIRNIGLLSKVYSEFPPLQHQAFEVQRAALSLDDVLSIATELAFGYIFPDANQQIGDQLRDIQATLDHVQDSLNQISSQLNEVLDRIDQVAEEIKGAITKEAYSDHLQFCQSFIEWVQPKIADPSEFTHNQEAIRDNFVNFQNGINQVLRTTQDQYGRDGLAGYLSVGESMAVWAQVQTLLLRADQSSQTVFDQPFHKDKFSRFIAVMDRVKQAKETMTAALDSIPHGAKSPGNLPLYLLHQDNTFKETQAVGIIPSFNGVEETNGTVLFASFFGSNEFAPVFDDAIPWGIVKPTILRARQLWPPLVDELKSIRFNLDYLKNSESAEAKLKELVSPPTRVPRKST